MRLFKIKLHWQILVALLVGIVAGLITGKDTTIGQINLYSLYNFLGDLFLRALKMLIVPLITSSIITGVAGAGQGRSLGRMGLKTLFYYMASSLAAILTGLFMVNLVNPGLSNGKPVKKLLGLTADTGELVEELGKRSTSDLVDILLRLIPENPLSAAAEGQILPLIFFCLLVGIFINQLKEDSSVSVVEQFWQGLFKIMMKLTSLVMLFAPLGVFGLIARTTAAAGLDVFRPLAFYVVTVFSSLLIHAFISLPLLLYVIGRINPIKYFRALLPALLTAFSTSSSSATLPVTMDCLQKGAGVSRRVSSFVLPLGATVNMDGTALYECVAAMFIAQAYGVELGPLQQGVVVLTALLASIGAAGIPSAGLVMLSIVLNAAGLPLEGVGLILAVDRILDMFRTSVNVWSDASCSAVVARSEGEKLEKVK